MEVIGRAVKTGSQLYLTHPCTHNTFTAAEEFLDYNLRVGGSLEDGGATVMLNSTATRGCTTIDISYDQLPEPTESFTVNLESRAEGISFTLSPNQTVVFILNNNGNYSSYVSVFLVRECQLC